MVNVHRPNKAKQLAQLKNIEEQPPYIIRLKGGLKEQVFKKVNFVIATELSTEAGAQHFSLHDT